MLRKCYGSSTDILRLCCGSVTISHGMIVYTYMNGLNKWTALILHHDVDEETGHYVIMLLEEEKVMLSGFSCSLFANYEERETCKEEEIYRSGWKAAWWQRRAFYGQYEKLVAELKGEGTKGLRNYIVPQSPSVKLRPVRTEPCIYKCRNCWSRDSENEPYTPWHNRTFSWRIRCISVSYP